jgi:nitrogen-specific signal transduction histidine kinase
MKTNKSTQHHTPLKNPLNPKKIIDSLPFAVFTRDDNFSVTGMNTAFRDLFPHAEELQHRCYNVIFGDDKTEPCVNCLVDNAIQHKKKASREVTVSIKDKKVSFRMVAVPILAEDGSVECVYKYIEDITARSAAEETISRYSNHLAHLTEESVLSLKKNEQDLAHMSNSFHEINMAKDITSLVQEIVNGFIKFRAFRSSSRLMTTSRNRSRLSRCILLRCSLDQARMSIHF